MLTHKQTISTAQLYAVEILLDDEWMVFELGESSNHLFGIASNLVNKGHDARVVRFARDEVVWKK
jgi:hypothetical protein